MLPARLISSLVFFLFLFLGLFHPWFGWVMPFLLLSACLAGLYEFVHFGLKRSAMPYIVVAMAGAAALLADAYWFRLVHALLILGLVTVLMLALETFYREKNFAEVGGKCLIGTLYVTLPLSLIMLIWREALANDNRDGNHYLIFLVLLTQSTDVGAYCVGRLFGRHKMAPTISPGKTWEGFAGGAAFTLLAAVAMKIFWNNMDRIFAWWEIFALAALFAAVGPTGDLAESWLKRASGVKDSGHTFTGHGGMLDIIDSLLFTTIVYYGFLWLFHARIL
jgi:phosphatidate cytidylyltransferase